MKKADVFGGRYYERRGPRSLHREVGPVRPHNVVCRRVVDYAPAPIPEGAAFEACCECSALVAYNPAGPHQDVPKLCMQCARITPLPIETT